MSKILATKRLLKLAILTVVLVTSSLTAIFVAAQGETQSDTMSKTILQINYQFTVSADEFVAIVPNPLKEGVPGPYEPPTRMDGVAPGQ